MWHTTLNASQGTPCLTKHLQLVGVAANVALHADGHDRQRRTEATGPAFAARSFKLGW